MSKIVLDLHPIYRDSHAIDSELHRVIREAVEKGIPTVEIIPGKGDGSLRRHVIRFLHLPQIKNQYHRIKIDQHNHGKVIVYFRG